MTDKEIIEQIRHQVFLLTEDIDKDTVIIGLDIMNGRKQQDEAGNEIMVDTKSKVTIGIHAYNYACQKGRTEEGQAFDFTLTAKLSGAHLIRSTGSEIPALLPDYNNETSSIHVKKKLLAKYNKLKALGEKADAAEVKKIEDKLAAQEGKPDVSEVKSPWMLFIDFVRGAFSDKAVKAYDGFKIDRKDKIADLEKEEKKLKNDQEASYKKAEELNAEYWDAGTTADEVIKNYDQERDSLADEEKALKEELPETYFKDPRYRPLMDRIIKLRGDLGTKYEAAKTAKKAEDEYNRLSEEINELRQRIKREKETPEIIAKYGYPALHPSQWYYKTCPNCNGSGGGECEKCDGEGTKLVNGKTRKCDACLGSGKGCTACFGNGYWRTQYSPMINKINSKSYSIAAFTKRGLAEITKNHPKRADENEQEWLERIVSKVSPYELLLIRTFLAKKSAAKSKGYTKEKFTDELLRELKKEHAKFKKRNPEGIFSVDDFIRTYVNRMLARDESGSSEAITRIAGIEAQAKGGVRFSILDPERANPAGPQEEDIETKIENNLRAWQVDAQVKETAEQLVSQLEKGLAEDLVAEEKGDEGRKKGKLSEEANDDIATIEFVVDMPPSASTARDVFNKLEKYRKEKRVKWFRLTFRESDRAINVLTTVKTVGALDKAGIGKELAEGEPIQLGFRKERVSPSDPVGKWLIPQVAYDPSIYGGKGGLVIKGKPAEISVKDIKGETFGSITDLLDALYGKLKEFLGLTVEDVNLERRAGREIVILGKKQVRRFTWRSYYELIIEPRLKDEAQKKIIEKLIDGICNSCDGSKTARRKVGGESVACYACNGSGLEQAQYVRTIARELRKYRIDIRSKQLEQQRERLSTRLQELETKADAKDVCGQCKGTGYDDKSKQDEAIEKARNKVRSSTLHSGKEEIKDMYKNTIWNKIADYEMQVYYSRQVRSAEEGISNEKIEPPKMEEREAPKACPHVNDAATTIGIQVRKKLALEQVKRSPEFIERLKVDANEISQEELESRYGMTKEELEITIKRGYEPLDERTFFDKEVSSIIGGLYQTEKRYAPEDEKILAVQRFMQFRPSGIITWGDNLFIEDNVKKYEMVCAECEGRYMETKKSEKSGTFKIGSAAKGIRDIIDQEVKKKKEKLAIEYYELMKKYQCDQCKKRDDSMLSRSYLSKLELPMCQECGVISGTWTEEDRIRGIELLEKIKLESLKIKPCPSCRGERIAIHDLEKEIKKIDQNLYSRNAELRRGGLAVFFPGLERSEAGRMLASRRSAKGRQTQLLKQRIVQSKNAYKFIWHIVDHWKRFKNPGETLQALDTVLANDFFSASDLYGELKMKGTEISQIEANASVSGESMGNVIRKLREYAKMPYLLQSFFDKTEEGDIAVDLYEAAQAVLFGGEYDFSRYEGIITKLIKADFDEEQALSMINDIVGGQLGIADLDLEEARGWKGRYEWMNRRILRFLIDIHNNKIEDIIKMKDIKEEYTKANDSLDMILLEYLEKKMQALQTPSGDEESNILACARRRVMVMREYLADHPDVYNAMMITMGIDEDRREEILAEYKGKLAKVSSDALAEARHLLSLFQEAKANHHLVVLAEEYCDTDNNILYPRPLIRPDGELADISVEAARKYYNVDNNILSKTTGNKQLTSEQRVSYHRYLQL